MNLLPVWKILNGLKKAGLNSKEELLSMANAMKGAFRPSFKYLMSPSDRGLRMVMCELAPFPVHSGWAVPDSVVVEQDSAVVPAGLNLPADFRCMLLTCLCTDFRFPEEGIASQNPTDDDRHGEDFWLVVGDDACWYSLNRQFTFREESDVKKAKKPEIASVVYRVSQLTDDALATKLVQSPNAIFNIARAFGKRSHLHMDSLRQDARVLEEIAMFGDVFSGDYSS